MGGHWHAWKSTAELCFCFGTDWANAMLLLAFIALNDGIHQSGFVFRVALHKGEHALLIAIGFVWADFLFFLWGKG